MTTDTLTPTHPPAHSVSHSAEASAAPSGPPSPPQAQYRGAGAPTQVALPSLTLSASHLSDFLPLRRQAQLETTPPPHPRGAFRTGAAMSQFSTMTTSERKMQAAAICREVQAQEDVEMDLGKKMNVPKDIMLEELSLASNRGSRLFKMRQRRSEKYTFESIQNENNTQLSSAAVFQTENGSPADSNNNENNSGDNQQPKVTCDAPDAGMVPNPASIAPGYGGPLKDIPPERFNSTAVPKSYHSPWEQAIINDPALADTLITRMPELEPRPDLPGYKSFNRVATPFGGFSKTPRPAPIRPIQVETLPELPELQGEAAVNRPSFNRSALGWVSAGGPVSLPTISLEPVLIPESEDL